jgi:hypothetical protein
MDAWQTYPIEFRGGLISNLSPLQQGMQAPGSARLLRNYEPSIEGGYRRIIGYSKFDTAVVPYYGAAVVQGGGQTGTTLVLANVSSAPVAGATVTIGVNTYTIDAGGVSYTAAQQSLTLTLTSALLSSPADGTAVVFSNNNALCTGVAAWNNTAIAIRGNDVYKSTNAGYTLINVPSYGTVLVDGGTQTGSSLVVDGLTSVPQVGDTFTIAGVDLTYIITASVTVTSGGATLSIYPALDSSPADDAAITFKTTKFAVGTKARFAKYRIGSTEKIAGVNGVSFPFIYDNATFKKLTSVSDLEAVEHIAWFKNSLFFAKGDAIYFSAPFTDDDYSAANGGGVINVGGKVTGLKVFREQLIIFTEQQIRRLVGNTAADYQLQPITENMGCVSSDTIQEIGGDIMFLAADGLRLLSATEKIGDFSLGSVSQAIQKELTALIIEASSFSSVVIRAKSQYRLLGHNNNVTEEATKGVLGTQLLEGGIGWAELRGIKAYVADSDYHNKQELVLFANANGYVYKLESGNSFDGENIRASFYTPYFQINDPRLRKTFYKLFTYVDPQGSFSATLSHKLDFDTKDSVQPEAASVSNVATTIGIYGNASSIFGVTRYGGKLVKVVETQLIGSGFSISLQYESDGTDPPYIFDAATIEFATHDRR